jgi:hypothetical protein
LGFSKVLEMHKAVAAWQDLVYNLARPLKSLRLLVVDDSDRRWRHRSPATLAHTCAARMCCVHAVQVWLQV